jgi:hypothetical protein
MRLYLLGNLLLTSFRLTAGSTEVSFYTVYIPKCRQRDADTQTVASKYAATDEEASRTQQPEFYPSSAPINKPGHFHLRQQNLKSNGQTFRK